MRRALGLVLGLVLDLVLGLGVLGAITTPARAQADDPRAVPNDLRDQQVRLWDQMQYLGVNKWWYGRFRTRDDGALWRDDKNNYHFEVDLNHPAQKNSTRTLKFAKWDDVKFRQLPHAAHWKLYRSRYPDPKLPDRGAIVALAKEAVTKSQKPEPTWELFLDEIRGGLLDTAARIFEDVIRVSPEWPTGYRELGALYRDRFDYENEMRTYLRARTAGALDADVLRLEAEALERLGLLGDAERSFQEALRLTPGDAAANLGLGRVRLRTARPEEALPAFEAAAAGRDVNVAGVAAQGLGRARLKLAKTPADLDAAIKAIEQARDRATDQAHGLDGGPLRKEVTHDLAVARLLQGRWGDAQDLLLGVLGLTELPKPPAPPAPAAGGDDDGAPAPPAGPRLAQEFDPWKARAHVNLGLAATRNEQHEAARECFALASALDPTSAEPWIALGALEEKLGDFYAAHQAYRQALVIDPEDAAARYTLGQLLFRANKLDEAEKELEEAIRLDPGMADALSLLGHVALRTQRDQAAARYFARAAEFLPEDAPLHAARGVALLRSGDLAGADAAFVRALQVDGKNVTAEEGRAWVEYARARGKRDREGQALALMQQLASDWSRQAQELIALQREKHQWEDFFDRRDGKKVGNRWEHALTNGPLVQLREGRAVLSGPVKKDPTQPAVELVRQSDRNTFVSIEATLWLDAAKPHAARLVVLGRRRDETLDALTFGRNAEGALTLGHYDNGEKRWKDLASYGPWPGPQGDGAGVRLGMERLMEGRRFLDRWRLTANGQVVAEVDVPFRPNADVWVGIQGAASLNLPIDITVDDVRIVEKRSK